MKNSEYNKIMQDSFERFVFAMLCDNYSKPSLKIPLPKNDSHFDKLSMIIGTDRLSNEDFDTYLLSENCQFETVKQIHDYANQLRLDDWKENVLVIYGAVELASVLWRKSMLDSMESFSDRNVFREFFEDKKILLVHILSFLGEDEYAGLYLTEEEFQRLSKKVD